MERRKALQFVGALIGGSFISTEIFLSGCKSDPGKEANLASEVINFNDQSVLLNAIGDTILPKTDKHPGFNATNATASLILLLNDCYAPENQKLLKDGLTTLNGFDKKETSEKIATISDLDKKYFEGNDGSLQFYCMLKEAILLSYFADDAVMTKTLDYVKVPGKYDGEFKIDPSTYQSIFGFGVG
ncbi:MAG: gluconate 2-dehydrogenase subunit 3 family protein [Saprospiraceae bacterium]|nr:gluconate 2-dehydrogenase subunit 3 family protein [Saprospiraceae bacterium]MBK8633514.1 gluconate 2-dehydrogenase subunit 3 family protein [Saprospiraceae bacterium]MBP7641767.1 gluconate 2-dehydrogenase subunit 3 family protein [Saprospiraceae bacterium]